MSVTGDLRFASHRDLMRVLALAAGRAELPLRYTEGFNPHPRLSLACPKPVGMASRDDLMVVVLGGPVEAADMLRRLNGQAPLGMNFSRAEPLARKPQPRRMTCRLPVSPDESARLKARLGELAGQTCWPAERTRTEAGNRGGLSRTTVDLRPLVEAIGVRDDVLEMSLGPREGRWAKPAEVLELVGMEGRSGVARMERGVEYRM